MKIVLIRGLPGSGKSTLAREYAARGFVHVEADMFFERDGRYEYRPDRVRDAHRWCQRQAERALRQGRSVVVANTFVRKWEMQPYLEMAQRHGAEVDVIVATGRWQNVHGVPPEKVAEMAARWEE
jgi:predicted kinase